MPYFWRTDTLRAVVIGGMAPKASSRGKQRHSPASRAVMQAKHGKHQKAKQPETKTTIQNVYLSLQYRMRTHKWCFLEAPECLITAANLQSDILACPISWLSSLWGRFAWEPNLSLTEMYDTLSVLSFSKYERSMGTFPDSVSTHTVAGRSSSHRSQSSICGPLWQRAEVGSWPLCHPWH